MHILNALNRATKNFPDNPAVVDGDIRLSWAEFGQRHQKLSAGLAGLGLNKGDRAATLMLNSFRYLELFFSLPAIGGIIVPLNTRLSPDEIAYILNDSEAVALFVDETFAPLVEKVLPLTSSIRHLIFTGKGATPVGMISYESLLENTTNTVQFTPAEEDLVGLFYTGGTTSQAKGVMLSHKNLYANALHFALHARHESTSKYLHVAPMFHLADGASTYALTMMGGCHVFLRAFDPRAVLETIQAQRLTHITLVPTMLNALLQLPSFQDYDLSSWQLLAYGASPIPHAVLERAMEHLPCNFMQAYGMTETSSTLTILSPQDHCKGLEAAPSSKEARRLASCGQPCVGVEVRLVDEAGNEVKPGQVGEIIAQGANITRGYWKLAQETAYGLREGWLHTGDLAWRDEQNYYYIVDRKKDMIISGGENIYSVEVENALYTHPAVLEAAVIGVPDEKYGERPHALVVLKPGKQASEEELISSCREIIAGYKLPRSVEFREMLPKSGAGKILKRSLREQYWQGQPRKVN